MRVFLPGHFAQPPESFALDLQLKRVRNVFRADENQAGAALGDIGKGAHDGFSALHKNEGRLAVARNTDVLAIFEHLAFLRSRASRETPGRVRRSGRPSGARRDAPHWA